MSKEKEETTKSTPDKPICGIIMPISAIEGCNEQHWNDVKRILSEAIEQAGYEPRIVSDADDSSVIQKRIVQNIYENEIVVCDVSCKNSNVMFELGLRLAFDKPVVIVKDDASGFSFDTSLIEHLTYPRSLSYYEIKAFQNKLSEKITNTVKESQKEEYSMFLKQFGEFKVSKINPKEGSIEEIITSRLDDLSKQVSQLYVISRRVLTSSVSNHSREDRLMREIISDYCKTRGISESMIWGNRDLEEDLFGHAEGFEELRLLCRNPIELRKTMIENLNPMSVS